MSLEGEQKQYEDLIESEDLTLSLENIQSIERHRRIREHFERKYGLELYSKILLILTHERFGAEEAKRLWKSINSHLSCLKEKLGRNPGIAVAAMDYLSNISNTLSAPVLIEEEKSEFISETTTKDGLTELYLRSVFDVMLEKELEKNMRTQGNLCLLMIDIDDFKKVNDQYGHTAGDEVLRTIGGIINANIRKMDIAARYGGEEIAVIAPESTPHEVVLLAERIRKKISKVQFSGFSVTVSIGVSQASPERKTNEKIINAADEALYDAKLSGKNRVVVHKGN